MPVVETVAAAATIASLVSHVTTHEQSKDVSNKIRDSLCQGRTNLLEILKWLDEFKEDLTLQERMVYMDQWRFLDAEASKGLAQSNEKENPFKRWMKRSRMKRAARRIENEILDLKSQIQQSSTTARLEKDRDPKNLERKTKEMEIRYMELEIKHKEVTQKLEDLNQKPTEDIIVKNPESSPELPKPVKDRVPEIDHGG